MSTSSRLEASTRQSRSGFHRHASRPSARPSYKCQQLLCSNSTDRQQTNFFILVRVHVGEAGCAARVDTLLTPSRQCNSQYFNAPNLLRNAYVCPVTSVAFCPPAILHTLLVGDRSYPFATFLYATQHSHIHTLISCEHYLYYFIHFCYRLTRFPLRTLLSIVERFFSSWVSSVT